MGFSMYLWVKLDVTAKDSNIISVLASPSACVHLCIQIISCLYLFTAILTVVCYYLINLFFSMTVASREINGQTTENPQ